MTEYENRVRVIRPFPKFKTSFDLFFEKAVVRLQYFLLGCAATLTALIVLYRR